jgi:16S rRNA (cytosine1402-N4)-methyltransferase
VPAARHIPVLLEEVVRILAPAPGQTVVDCTAGLGGHAIAMAGLVGPSGTLVLNDLDASNLTEAEARVYAELGSNAPRIVSFLGNFSHLPRRMARLSLRADAALADLGFSSSQMDNPSRGFSFSADGPLDMRLAHRGDLTRSAQAPVGADPDELPPSAAELIASLPESELTRIIREYGEERNASAIARKIAGARREHPISTTWELARIVRSASGRGAPGGIDPATRTFQAIRIAVNDELGNLDALLHAVRGGMAAAPRPDWLAPGARIGVISFHSLEDRPVKRMFADMVASGVADDLADGCLTPGEEEILRNPRSRSAKLRVVRRR